MNSFGTNENLSHHTLTLSAILHHKSPPRILASTPGAVSCSSRRIPEKSDARGILVPLVEFQVYG